MRSRGPWIAFALTLIVGVIAALWTAAAGANRPPGHPPAAHRIAIWSGGSWCWFADPRAVHVVGQYDQTFAGWIDWNGAVTVGAYDARFHVRKIHVVGHLFHDDHSSPAIFVEPDRRLTVFYSAHNGNRLYYRTTLRPEDISAWGPVQRVRSRLPGGLGFTYPNPALLPAESNRLYLFWRGAKWGIDYAARSIDGRWHRAHHLIAAPGERPYMKDAVAHGDTIGLAFTNGHPRERMTSVYYAAYRAGRLWHAGGRPIVHLGHAPIRPRQADVVYDGRRTGVSSWMWDVAFGRDGRPVIVYATFPSPGDHLYWYARFTGSRWVSHLITHGGPTISPGTIELQYSGGLALDHAHPSTVILSRKVAGAFELQRWSTPDGGSSWRHETLVRVPGSDSVRPVLARGAGPQDAMGLLWLEGRYGSYSNYRTRIAYLH
jgi:hypothetical protein